MALANNMQKKAKNSSQSESTAGSQFQLGELDASSDLLGFAFSKSGGFFAFLSGLLAFAMIAVKTEFQGWAAAANGAAFAVCLFWLFRSYLPTTLLVRVKDILRYRYAFLTIDLAATLAVLSAPAFLASFSEVNLSSLCMTAGILCPFLMVCLFSLRSRFLLAVILFLCGGLCVTHPIGLVSGASLIFTVFYVRGKCSGAIERMHCDETYSEAFSERMRPVFASLSMVHHSLVLCGFSFVLGAGVLIGYHTSLSSNLVLEHLTTLVRGTVGNHLTPNYLAILASGVILAVLANLCSRRASDITLSLTGPYIILFGGIGLFALTWPLNFISHIPPFSDFSVGDVRSQSLLPDVFVASALAISVAVFIVDVCCRDTSEMYDVDDSSVRKLSPLMRNVRAGLTTGILLAVVVFTAYRSISR